MWGLGNFYYKWHPQENHIQVVAHFNFWHAFIMWANFFSWPIALNAHPSMASGDKMEINWLRYKSLVDAYKWIYRSKASICSFNVNFIQQYTDTTIDTIPNVPFCIYNRNVNLKKHNLKFYWRLFPTYVTLEGKGWFKKFESKTNFTFVYSRTRKINFSAANQ